MSLQAWVEKTVLKVEAYWLSGKEKVLASAVTKEGEAGWQCPGTWKDPSLDFLEKSVTINL